MKNEILKKVQDEGLAILKLNERLEQANIEHTFIKTSVKPLALAMGI